jgi:hypothetical protein
VVAGRLAEVAQPLQRRGCLERRRPSAIRVKLESIAHAATLPAAALVEAVASRSPADVSCEMRQAAAIEASWPSASFDGAPR